MQFRYRDHLYTTKNIHEPLTVSGSNNYKGFDETFKLNVFSFQDTVSLQLLDWTSHYKFGEAEITIGELINVTEKWISLIASDLPGIK